MADEPRDLAVEFRQLHSPSIASVEKMVAEAEARVLRRIARALRGAEGGHFTGGRFTLSINTLNVVADALEKEAERG